MNVGVKEPREVYVTNIFVVFTCILLLNVTFVNEALAMNVGVKKPRKVYFTIIFVVYN